jgi:PKD repeat protein
LLLNSIYIMLILRSLCNYLKYMPKLKPTLKRKLTNKNIAPFSAISRTNLLVFALIFVAIGGYVLYRSFAAPNPNLPGDLNNDNVVNVSDLSMLLSKYGTNDSSADINKDGTVNIGDLSILLSNYGKSGVPSGGPTAAYTISPSGPATGEAVTFTSASTCPAGPCTYKYENDTGGGNFAVFGTSSVSTFTYQNAGSKTARLTVTDAQNRSDSITKTFDVASSGTPTPTPLPPPGGGGTVMIEQTAKQGMPPAIQVDPAHTDDFAIVDDPLGQKGKVYRIQSVAGHYTNVSGDKPGSVYPYGKNRVEALFGKAQGFDPRAGETWWIAHKILILSSGNYLSFPANAPEHLSQTKSTANEGSYFGAGYTLDSSVLRIFNDTVVSRSTSPGPFDRWLNLDYEMHFDTSSSKGWYRKFLNGQEIGSQKYTQTLYDDLGHDYIKFGSYRNQISPNMPTFTVYHAGVKVASTQTEAENF